MTGMITQSSLMPHRKKYAERLGSETLEKNVNKINSKIKTLKIL